MTPPTDDASTLAVVVARIDDLRTDVASLRAEIKDRDVTYVSRAEFEAWRTGIGREIGDIKASAARSRAPWWSVAAVAVAASSLLVTIVPALAR